MNNFFKSERLSEREGLIAQLVVCIALDGRESKYFEQAMSALNLEEQDIEVFVSEFENLEKALAESDESLSDLLANASKSTCCS